MQVKQLIKRLNEIVEANPENADIDVKWYDTMKGTYAHGDCWPVQLFYYPFMEKTYCVLNAVDGAPGCYVAVSDKGYKHNDKRTERNA